mmetsp:Transcript_7184/g.13245  ORF Transcript_7184/g.13245 Transcript_7184/m.13245 type:complete len:280 (-) Transcript_7184:170-1009(-)
MIMSFTSSYSGNPMRRQLLTSMRSTTAECSPEEPRAWQLRSRAILSMASKPMDLMSFGTRMCTEPRMPVPMLEGQHVTDPNLGCIMKISPSACPTTDLTPASMAAAPADSRENTAFTSPPFSIEMMRRWSPSFTQFTNVLSGLWNTPRPCGQCSWYPDAACMRSLPRNSWCPSMSAWRCSSDMVVCKKNSPFSSSLYKPEYTLPIISVICSRDSLLPPGFNGNMDRLRATRMRVDTILALAASDSSVAIFDGSMRSDAVPFRSLPFSMENPLWYASITG